MSNVTGRRPVVSVIVPTYADYASRLHAAIASIWAQDGLGDQFDVEPIVVDNASTGPTAEVVRSFPGTRYVRLETNTGQCCGRNIGLAEATGKYVAFLDHDDLWLPQRLSDQVALLEQAQGLEVAYSQRAKYMRDGSLNVGPGSDAPSGWVFETGLQAGAIAHLDTILIPRAALDKVGGFDERLSIGEDGDFVARLALLFPFRYVPGVVAIYLPSTNQWSEEQRREARMVTQESLLALIRGEPKEAEIKKLVLSTTSYHIANHFYRGGEFDDARREFLRWIAEFRPLEGDAWARSKMREMLFLLAAASDSPADRASLCKEVKRAEAARGLKQRLRMRALLADVWTAAAVRFASRRRRNRRMAGSAALRAILENPLKPLSRPGLLRLAARAIVPFGRGPAAQPAPSRKVVSSEAHWIRDD